MGTNLNLVLKKLNRLRLRLTLRIWADRLSNMLAAAAALSCIWLILTRLFPALGNPWPAVAVFFASALLASAISAFLDRPDLVQTALAADREMGLKERLTSALEMALDEGSMVAAQRKDAEVAIRDLDPVSAFPFTAAWTLKATPAIMLVFILALNFMPELDLLKHREKKAKAQALAKAKKEKVDKLRAMAKKIEPSKGDDFPEAKDLADKLNQLAEDINDSSITDKRAAARMSDISREMKEAGAEMMKYKAQPQTAPGQKGQGQEMAKSLAEGDYKDFFDKLAAMKKKLSDGKLSDREKEKLLGDLKELAKAMGGAETETGKNLLDALDKAERSLSSGDPSSSKALKDLAESLDQIQSAANQMKNMDETFKELAQFQNQMMGNSSCCRNCGKKPGEGEKFSNGLCPSCAGSLHVNEGLFGPPDLAAGLRGYEEGDYDPDKVGEGMVGKGRGEGNWAGELPEVEAGFSRSVLPGPTTKGKILATIVEKAAPDEGAGPTVEFVEGVITEVQRDAENALIHEEIPAESKEFVREYFRSLEPDGNDAR